jgi:hypothetical protein
VKTEWKATDDPRWPLTVLVHVVVAAVVVVLVVGVWHRPVGLSLAYPAASLLAVLGVVRGRVRLTDEGVEVRRLRTRVYRWSDIVSVERAPEWEDTSLVWLRRRGSVPTSSPDVLALPGLRRGGPTDEILDDLVALIRRRAGIDQSGAATSTPSAAP